MEIIAGYVRVSTDEQRDKGYSIDEQIRSIQKYFDLYFCSNDYRLEIFNDGGYSGRNVDRPGITKICNLVKLKKIHSVVFVKLDRLSRSIIDTQNLVKVFQNHGVNMISIFDKIDLETASGEFTFNIKSSVAQYESRQISERTRIGLDGKAKTGLYPYSNLPLGISRNEDGTLKYNEDIEVVKFIFNSYLKYRSTKEVSRVVKEKYNSINIKHNYYLKMLKNPLYRGYFERETFDKEIIRTNVLDPIFTNDDIELLLTINFTKKRKSHHKYAFENKVFMFDGKKMRHAKQKKTLSTGKVATYNYYYSNEHSLYVNENTIMDAVVNAIRINKKKRDLHVENKFDELLEMYTQDKITVEEYKKGIEKLRKLELRSQFKRVEVSLDKRIKVIF